MFEWNNWKDKSINENIEFKDKDKCINNIYNLMSIYNENNKIIAISSENYVSETLNFDQTWNIIKYESINPLRDNLSVEELKVIEMVNI